MSLKPKIDTESTNFEFVSRDDTFQQRKGTIAELHGNSGESLLRGRDINEMQNDWLIMAKHISVGNAEE
jgi:hypothetical protein